MSASIVGTVQYNREYNAAAYSYFGWVTLIRAGVAFVLTEPSADTTAASDILCNTDTHKLQPSAPS